MQVFEVYLAGSRIKHLYLGGILGTSVNKHKYLGFIWVLAGINTSISGVNWVLV